MWVPWTLGPQVRVGQVPGEDTTTCRCFPAPPLTPSPSQSQCRPDPSWGGHGGSLAGGQLPCLSRRTGTLAKATCLARPRGESPPRCPRRATGNSHRADGRACPLPAWGNSPGGPRPPPRLPGPLPAALGQKVASCSGASTPTQGQTRNCFRTSGLCQSSPTWAEGAHRTRADRHCMPCPLHPPRGAARPRGSQRRH